MSASWPGAAATQWLVVDNGGQQAAGAPALQKCRSYRSTAWCCTASVRVPACLPVFPPCTTKHALELPCTRSAVRPPPEHPLLPTAADTAGQPAAGTSAIAQAPQRSAAWCSSGWLRMMAGRQAARPPDRYRSAACCCRSSSPLRDCRDSRLVWHTGTACRGSMPGAPCRSAAPCPQYLSSHCSRRSGRVWSRERPPRGYGAPAPDRHSATIAARPDAAAAAGGGPAGPQHQQWRYRSAAWCCRYACSSPTAATASAAATASTAALPGAAGPACACSSPTA